MIKFFAPPKNSPTSEGLQSPSKQSSQCEQQSSENSSKSDIQKSTEKTPDPENFDVIFQDYLQSMKDKTAAEISNNSASSDSEDSDGHSSSNNSSSSISENHGQRKKKENKTRASDKKQMSLPPNQKKKRENKISKSTKIREKSLQDGSSHCPTCVKNVTSEKVVKKSSQLSNSKQKKMLLSVSKNLKSICDKLSKAIEN